ncbi:MAG: hypothetical protein KGL95_15015 [Patescibacteria group bacterium]|nr:hypothetical protein [Patescibacteria group bacterium]
MKINQVNKCKHFFVDNCLLSKVSNPFMPGNGIEPRYLAGREEFIEFFERSLKSYEGGLPRNTVLSGLRGSVV